MNESSKKIEGILPAIASPCDENKVFLEDKFLTLAESLYEADINGLYVCGGTGDGWNMSVAERKRAAEIAIDLSKKYDGTVVIHVGCMLKSDDSVLLVEHAARAGADAVSSIPPKDLDQKELVEYYTDLAKASDLPVFVYHFPMLTGRTPSVEEIIELLDIPGVIGLKMTDWNLFMMKRLRLARPEVIIFSGFDEILCPGLMYGANGGIGTWYNLFPKLYVAIYKAVQSGNISRAMDLQQRLVAFCDTAWIYGIRETFEFLMAKRGFGPKCFRDFQPTTDTETLKSIEPELDKKIAAIEGVL